MRRESGGVREEVREVLTRRGIPFADEIASYCARLVEKLGPQMVLLTGSIAMGAHMPWSDVDMIVVADFEEPFIERIALLLELNETRAPIEALGYTMSEFRSMLFAARPNVVDAVRNGIPLIGDKHYRSLKKILGSMKLRRTSCTYITDRRSRLDRMSRKALGPVVQAIGAILVLLGPAYEIAVRASLGLILITLGSLIFAIGVKLRKG